MIQFLLRWKQRRILQRQFPGAEVPWLGPGRGWGIVNPKVLEILKKQTGGNVPQAFFRIDA